VRELRWLVKFSIREFFKHTKESCPGGIDPVNSGVVIQDILQAGSHR
jgi:hypothetical protein